MSSFLQRLPVFRWHEANVYSSRVKRLIPAIAELAEKGTSMLDVGCGDGSIARDVARSIGATDLHGVDVKIRPQVHIDVREYDGHKLPFEDRRFDVVTICDVLHHAETPLDVMKEAIRVLKPGGALVIKDHFRLSPWSNGVLWAMDVVGNFAPGVLVRGFYLSPPEWIQLVENAGGMIDKLLWPFRIHDAPWRLVARSEYQFLMRVRKK